MYISRDGSILKTYISIQKNIMAGNEFSLFTYSREAIFTIFSENNISLNDEVLLPKYICSTVIESILPFTNNILFYSINEDMTFQSEEIMALVSEKTKLIFFVDYFGVDTHVTKELEMFLKTRNILILKDSAHSFLSLIKNGFQKYYAYDYLISSIYKNIPLQVGSFAMGSFQKPHNFVNMNVFIKRIIILFIKNFLSYFKQTQYINKNVETITISNSEYKDYSYGINISKAYSLILKHLNFTKIIKEKEELTKEYYDFFVNSTIYTSLFSESLIQKNVLQVYPIKCNNIKERDTLLILLKKEFIDAYTWPTFHKINVDEGLWNKIILLPIDTKAIQVIKKILTEKSAI